MTRARPVNISAHDPSPTRGRVAVREQEEQQRQDANGNSALSPMTASSPRSGTRPPPIVPQSVNETQSPSIIQEARPAQRPSRRDSSAGATRYEAPGHQVHISRLTAVAAVPRERAVGFVIAPSAIACWMCRKTAGPSAIVGSPTTTGAVTGWAAVRAEMTHVA